MAQINATMTDLTVGPPHPPHPPHHGSEIIPGVEHVRGYRKCKHRKCNTCNIIKSEGQVFRSIVTGIQYPLPVEKVTCDSSGLIYLVSDKQCVGKSTTSLKERHNKHRHQLRNKTEALGQHFSSCGAENFQLQVIELVQECADLRDREGYWMNELRTLSPYGMNLRNEAPSGRRH